jgi:peptidoglycan/LPS O-acetylase OafA/YrhL
VLWHHSPGRDPFGNPIFGRGYLGVDLFFVLSGFLITTILVRQRRETGTIDLKRFYWRRSLRIFPLYYLFLAGLVLLYAVTDQEKLAGYLGALPVYALYLTNWIEIEGFNTFHRGWSLAVEEQFYLVWPLVLMLGGARLGVAVAIAATAATFALGSGAVGGVKELGQSLVPFRTILLGGCLAIALDNQAGHAWAKRLFGWRHAILVIAAALVVFLVSVTGPLRGFHELSVHLLMLALVAAVVLKERSLAIAVLDSGPFRFVGLVSYGVYVLHGQAHGAAESLLEQVGGAALANERLAFFVAMTGISLAAAAVSYHFVERPFLALKGRDMSLRSFGAILRRSN